MFLVISFVTLLSQKLDYIEQILCNESFGTGIVNTSKFTENSLVLHVKRSKYLVVVSAEVGVWRVESVSSVSVAVESVSIVVVIVWCVGSTAVEKGWVGFGFGVSGSLGKVSVVTKVVVVSWGSGITEVVGGWLGISVVIAEVVVVIAEVVVGSVWGGISAAVEEGWVSFRVGFSFSLDESVTRGGI